jgi:hypothetical protein
LDNNLELDIDNISKFLNKIEFTKENVIEIVEYVHYKSILDAFTYVIESSKNSNDTGLLAVEYVEASKKLESVFEILVEKITKNYGKEVGTPSVD